MFDVFRKFSSRENGMIQTSVSTIRSSPSLPAVLIRNLSIAFPGKRAGEQINVLDHIDAEVARGEFACLVGPSGCGKSTLLNIVAGFLNPTSGQIRIGGKAVTGHGMDRGIVFQDFAQL